MMVTISKVLKALLTQQAAAHLGLAPVAKIIPVERDEAHVRLAKGLLRQRRLWSRNKAWAL